MTLDFTDSMDFSIFSDLFKDRHGFRPRGLTVDQMKDWMVFPGPMTSEEIRAEMEEDERRYQEEKAAYEAQEAAWEAEQQQKRDDFDFFPWQLQAGKLRNLPEAMILEY
jgi:uncharacterized damage-inducible protein DinB